MNSDEVGEDDISKARNAFQTGLGTVDKLRDARCTWTLKGWRETLKDGTQVMRAEKMTEEELEAEAEADAHKSKVSEFYNATIELLNILMFAGDNIGGHC